MSITEQLGVEAVRRTVMTFRDAVHEHAAALNRLNVYPIPDGDTGTNMARTLDAVVEAVEAAPSELVTTCEAISHGSLMGARGNSGVILSQILRGWATTMAAPTDGARGTGRQVAEALVSASQAAYQAVLKPVEGTILTVAREAADAALRAAQAGGTLVEVLEAAERSGRDALARTPELLPVLRDAGVVDAGGAGFMLFIDAALHVVAGRPLPTPDEAEGPGPSLEQLAAVTRRQHGARGGDAGGVDVSELRYEVMFFLDLPDERIDAFKQGWGGIGDSIVVVGGDGLWNCHVHTNDIGAAIEVPLELDGRPRQIRITDLFEEVADEHVERERALGVVLPAPGAGLPAVTTAVVAVCSGDGLAELFAGLGVQGIVAGGQTLNPSTAELLAAVEHVNAEQVVLLPNNKNIVPVARQVDALAQKSVRVVATCSMPEALAALVVYDPEANVTENVEAMERAVADVATGEVTQAVRDATSPAGPIPQGAWMGLVRGDGIVAVHDTVLGACERLLDQLLRPEHELLTVIEGEGATAEVTAALREWIATRQPQVDVEVHRGGQPLYPYLFGAE